MGLRLIFPDAVYPRREIGGKALNLFQMKASGLPVPDWVVIPRGSLDELMHTHNMDHEDFDQIRHIISETIISDSVITQITGHFAGVDYFAVRSSAIDEDGADHSFAGLFETELYISPENLADAIRKVWLSAFSERVISYRQRFGITVDPGIAVIIQKMVHADTAGVAFGIDPVLGSRNTMVVNSVYGLGEGLVSGALNADRFYVQDGIIRSEIVHKSHQFVLKNGKTSKAPVNEKLSDQPSLTDQQVMEVAGILSKLKSIYGKPQDIEFAFENESLFLLQTRPVTGIERLKDPEGEFIVWDNSNIIESYPGVTTPLTFSFIIKVYEAVYKQMSALMGVRQSEIEDNANVFANMLGLINGRVYYNLVSWYKLLAMLPGYALNAEFMEKMMGVKERFTLKDLPERSRFAERIRILYMVRIMLRNLRRLPRMRKEFVRDFNAVMTAYQHIDFNTCKPGELMRLYFDFETTLLKKWKAPLINDFFAMIYFGVLQKLVVKYKLDNEGAIHNDLLSGANDIISTEPITMTQNITGIINKDAEAKELFISHNPSEIWNILLEGKAPKIKKEIDRYLNRFGERVVGELKLETVSFTQNPAAFIKILKSYIEAGETTSSTGYDKEKIRKDAESQVVRQLKNQPLKKLIFNYVLRKSRSLVSNRENLRYERTRAFGVVRLIFSAMGKQFYAENLIDLERDIFYLKKEEIFDFIQGTSVHRNLKVLIGLRKKEFAEFEARPTAERITTFGMVYQGNDFNHVSGKTIQNGDLKGIGCCPGVVRARVRVLRNPDEMDSLEGDILVTSSTDPGWVILFPSAAAILVERGSLLSHSAIVSREMGIPCIVGISGLLDTLNTGDLVEMDGSTGNLKILERHGC